MLSMTSVRGVAIMHPAGGALPMPVLAVEADHLAMGPFDADALNQKAGSH
ncbi:hypothetical protein ABIE89_000387 [Bradyrhizobium niftali]